MELEDIVSADILEKYEFYNYGHSLEILTSAFEDEWSNITECLKRFEILKSELTKGGGNESPIPKKFNSFLRPAGWKEIRITGDLIVKQNIRKASQQDDNNAVITTSIPNYIDGYNIDFVKNKIALDVEWNSKDQTFDRDLLAMRAYQECGIIDVGVIITRSEELNEVFAELGIMKKYGASTTWMGKLIPRLDARRNGGCPILAIGIKKSAIV